MRCSSSIKAEPEALLSKLILVVMYFHACLTQVLKSACMNVETCTALGLLHSVTDTNTQVNTVSGQDMGIVGSCCGHI